MVESALSSPEHCSLIITVCMPNKQVGTSDRCSFYRTNNVPSFLPLPILGTVMCCVGMWCSLMSFIIQKERSFFSPTCKISEGNISSGSYIIPIKLCSGCVIWLMNRAPAELNQKYPVSSQNQCTY